MSLETFHDLGPGVPFPHPIPLPSALPTDAPHVSLCLNHDWLPIVVGCLKVLLDPATFDADQATYQATRLDIWNLLQNWSNSCVSDIQFRQNTDCTLQVSMDGGVTWTEIFNAETCILRDLNSGELAAGGGASPGPTSEGTCRTFHAQVPVANGFILPTTVDAGDTIIISNAGGAWSDGWAGQFWYCPDGQEFALGACFGGPTTPKVGDPNGGVSHMRLLVEIAGVTYDGYNTTITVPGGVSAAQVKLIPNDDPAKAASGAGTVTCDVEVCANAITVTFDGWGTGPAAIVQGATYDFTTTPSGTCDNKIFFHVSTCCTLEIMAITGFSSSSNPACRDGACTKCDSTFISTVPSVGFTAPNLHQFDLNSGSVCTVSLKVVSVP